MAQYEFNASDSAIFKRIATRLAHVGLLTIATGVMRLVYVITLSSSEGFGTRAGYWLVAALLAGVVGVFLWRPADNFRRVADTSGQDMRELMVGIRELNLGFNVVQYLLIVVVAWGLVDIVSRLFAR